MKKTIKTFPPRAAMMLLVMLLTLTAQTVKAEDCLYGAISGDYPNWTMTLKYGDYDADPADAGANNKKKYTPGSSVWWNKCANTGMKTIVIDASCQTYQGTSLKGLFYNWQYVTSITGLCHTGFRTL